MSGLPAMRLSLAVVVSISGPGLGWAPGAPCGHRGRVVWPGPGCQAGSWANRLPQMPTVARRSRSLRMDSRASGFELRTHDRR